MPRESPCWSPICNHTTADLQQNITSYALQQPPNHRPSYSNYGFSLVGRLVAEYGFGMSFEDAMIKFVLKPLGLSRSGNDVNAWLRGSLGDNAALPYLPHGAGVNPQIGFSFGWSSPCGQMYSSPKDLATVVADLDAGYRGNGKLFKDQEIYSTLMHSEFVDFAPDSGFAMPFETLNAHGYNAYRKGGNAAGYSALVVNVPDLRLGIVLNFNGFVIFLICFCR